MGKTLFENGNEKEMKAIDFILKVLYIKEIF